MRAPRVESSTLIGVLGLVRLVAKTSLALAGTWGAPGGQVSELQLDWQTPSQCPDARWVRDKVAEYTDTTTADVGAQTRVRASVVSVDANMFRLSLEIDTPSGRSRTDAERSDCTQLADIVAVKVALALDAASSERPAAPPPGEDDETPPALRRSDASAPPRDSWGWLGLWATPEADWGAAPGFGPAFVGGLAAANRWVRAGLGAGFRWPRSVWKAGDRGDGATVRHVFARTSLALRWHPRARQWEGRMGAVLDLGATRAQHYRQGRDDPAQSVLYGAIGVRVGALWSPHPHVAVGPQFTLGANLVRHRIFVDGTAFDLPPVVLIGGLLVEVRKKIGRRRRNEARAAVR